MSRPLITALFGLFAATPVVAQEQWATFHNTLTERQGAFVCSVFDEGTGDFFCLELACEEGGPLVMEVSRDGAAMVEELEAQITINGVAMTSYAFAQSSETGFSTYSSQAAAADEALRYWLAQGSSAQVSIGDDTEALSLRGSSAALSDVFAACPAG